ncbi:alpha/beta hydrolase [Longispora sp. K20-0274]|uniref:alpha/beta hydrolase n=1 Tax=Longispora sp. K20-0274 TaxID=3088255 RepID=UPI0039995CE3
MKDFGGAGAPIVLLHGLMGRARAWTGTADWLTGHGRVLGLDSRGHGAAPPGPFDTDTRVADVIAVLDEVGPAVLVGHSMGGMTAWQVAGRRPDLVRGIVIIDMSALGKGRTAGWRAYFDTWPESFASRAEVEAFFGREHAGQGRFFADIMDETPDGRFVPHFDPSRLLELVDSWQRDMRAELDAVKCPAVVVRGELSKSSREELVAMGERLPAGSFAEVAGAGHVVHYDRPEGFRAAVEPFVAALAH